MIDPLIRYDGIWKHWDARPTERAVIHPPTPVCHFEGRHPEGDCALARRVEVMTLMTASGIVPQIAP